MWALVLEGLIRTELHFSYGHLKYQKFSISFFRVKQVLTGENAFLVTSFFKKYNLCLNNLSNITSYLQEVPGALISSLLLFA